MREATDVDTCPRCQKCDRWRAAPDVLRDPMLLWERFPCPPPGTDHTRLILELDWTGQIGTPRGCEALKRVARRCNVDLKQIVDIPPSLVECEALFDGVGLCGTQCVIAVILAVICLFFFLLLIVVCRRYVRGTTKESSTICTKVLSPEHTTVNAQTYKYYVQNQYFHRPNNIPERRRLPCEARLVENGVEARLLRAIQETPVHHYNVEDLCPQCQAESRHCTLKYNRSRGGYETIDWKDKDYFQKRVPSMDSINRNSMTYQRSNNGSSSDVSHLYEYISDYPFAPSYNSAGRTSCHSPKLYSRNNSMKRSSSRNIAAFNMVPEGENLQYTRRNTDDTRNDMYPSRRSITSVHSRYEDKSPFSRYRTDRSPYQPSGSESSDYQTRVCDRRAFYGYNSDIPPDLISGTHRKAESIENRTANDDKGNKANIQPPKDSDTGLEPNDDSKSIKGYTFSFNPSYEEKRKLKNVRDPTRSNTASEQQKADSTPDSGIGRTRYKRKGKSRRKSSDSCNSNCSESTSLTGSYNTNVFQSNKNYNTGSSKK